jgi:hypothetical protein
MLAHMQDTASTIKTTTTATPSMQAVSLHVSNAGPCMTNQDACRSADRACTLLYHNPNTQAPPGGCTQAAQALNPALAPVRQLAIPCQATSHPATHVSKALAHAAASAPVFFGPAHYPNACCLNPTAETNKHTSSPRPALGTQTRTGSLLTHSKTASLCWLPPTAASTGKRGPQITKHGERANLAAFHCGLRSSPQEHRHSVPLVTMVALGGWWCGTALVPVITMVAVGHGCVALPVCH